MLPLSRPDLLIFDCDGVLIDSQHIQCRIDAAEFSRLGYSVTADELLRQFTGFTTKDMQAHVERVLGRSLSPDFGDQRVRLIDAAYQAELKIIPGVREMLAEIGLPSCVASNGRTFRVKRALALIDLLSLFEPHVFGADLVMQPKPAPELFLFAAARMGVPAARCLVIEDSVVGVRAAVAAGMPVLGFYGGGHCYEGYEADLSAAGAAAVFRDMRYLKVLVDGAG
jgi:HAD superfamily hydrolase (TIGR01509 family)